MKSNSNFKKIAVKSVIILAVVLLFSFFPQQTAHAWQINFPSWLTNFKNFISKTLNLSAKPNDSGTEIKFTGPSAEEKSEKTTAGSDKKDYWVYIRTYDKPEVSLGQTGGRSKKGDIVQILDASIYKTPSETEKKEWLIIKVSGLTQDQINMMMQSWSEDKQVYNKKTKKNETATETKAYRKYKIDINNLKSQEGINITKGLWKKKIEKSDITNRLQQKDNKDISRYYWQSVKYALINKTINSTIKLVNLIIPKARAATINTKTVIPAGGGDYASLSLWEDARDGDLVAAGTIEVANCSGATADTTSVSIDGWTCSSDNYIKIIGDWTPPTSGNFYDTTKYRLELTGDNAFGIYRTAKLYNIQFQYTPTANGDTLLYVANWSDTGSINFVNCIFKGVMGSYSDVRNELYYYGGEAVGSYFMNCVFWDWTASWTAPILARGGIHNIYNCTFHNCNFGVSTQSGTTINATNCIFHDVTTDSNSDGGGTRNLTTCDTADGDYFTDEANDNFHLAAGAAPIDAGTDLSATFTTDIDGATRTGSWDIGADEVAAGTTPQIRIKGGVKIKGGVRIKKN